MDKKKSLLLLSAVAIGSTLYNILKPVHSKVNTIEDFDLKKYLGNWFEIARLDFFWEKNLKNVQAKYELNPDGSIAVTNSGYDTYKKKQKIRRGTAMPVEDEHKGALKVSFFGPIYSPYNIMHIDEDYKYALIFGGNTDYMWILSREQTIPEEIKQKYLNFAQESGYSTQDLVWTQHD